MQAIALDAAEGDETARGQLLRLQLLVHVVQVPQQPAPGAVG